MDEKLRIESAEKILKFAYGDDIGWNHTGTMDDSSWRNVEKRCLFIVDSIEDAVISSFIDTKQMPMSEEKVEEFLPRIERIIKQSITSYWSGGIRHYTISMAGMDRLKSELTQLLPDREKVSEIREILKNGVAGLAIDHPEYYENQSFAVIPTKLLNKVVELADALYGGSK